MKYLSKISVQPRCIAALLLLLLLPAGCELEYVDTGKIEVSSFPKTEEEVEALLNYMYRDFTRQYYGLFEGYTMAELVTDLATSAWPDRDPYVYNHYEANSSCYNNAPEYNYAGFPPYEYLPLLSTLILDIDRMNTVEFDETRKNRYIAELKCGMGWLGFILYDLYGPVPIPTLEILRDPLRGGGILIGRASEEEMQEFIETNLKEAAEALPYDIHSTHENRYSSEDYGRFSKGLANFALMKFYMLMGRWADAEAMGRELLKPEYGYRLMANYNDLFTLANEKNAESIFSAIPPPSDGHIWFSSIMPGTYPEPGIVKWGGWRMSWPFYETFEAGDARTLRIIADYEGTDGLRHNKANDHDGGMHGEMWEGPYPVKYDWTSGVAGTHSEIDWIVYRYADVLTLLSEAIVRNKNAVTQEAVDLLNQVRTRALPGKGYTLNDLNNVDKFYEKMLLERGHEFYYEFTRRQDLIRHGKFIEFAIEKNKYYGQTYSHLETPEGAQKYLRFAIPQYYITLGRGIIEQNPGF